MMPRVRYWDLAATLDGDWTAGVLFGRSVTGIFYVIDIIRGKWQPMHRNNVIRQAAASDGAATWIFVEQEPGSGGKEAADLLVRDLAGYMAQPDRPTGDIVARVGPLAAQAEAGNVRLVRGPWNEAFLRELHDFPDGAHDDQVAAAAGAFNKLALEIGTGQVEMRALGGVSTNGTAKPVSVQL